MSNRIASTPAPRSAAALLLTLLVVWIGGCNTVAAPPPAVPPAGDVQKIPLPDARSRMDPVRNRLWILTHDRVVLLDITTSKKIEIDLPGWQWADTQFACLPDLALGPRGEAIVTSNVVPTLWRIDPETLAVSVHGLVLDADRGRDVGFSGLAYSVEHGAFFAVNDTHGSLWRIDPLLETGREVRLSEPIRSGTCEEPLARVAREGA